MIVISTRPVPASQRAAVDMAERTRPTRARRTRDAGGVVSFSSGNYRSFQHRARGNPLPSSPTRGEVPLCARGTILPDAPEDTLPHVGRDGEGVAARKTRAAFPSFDYSTAWMRATRSCSAGSVTYFS